MIGSGLKKLAKQNGMSVSNGVAYGNLKGFATTMSEGNGYALFEISTTFPQLAQKEAFYAAVNAVDHSRTYRVQRMEIGDRKISVVFANTVGTVKKIEEFIQWFYPLLAQYGATGAHLCAHCGSDASAGGWYLVDGVVHRFHDTCAEQLKATIQTEQQEQRAKDDGSYVQGFFGALGGALIGAILWAIIYMAGYIAAIVGLVAGWLAEKGYNLLRGKQGKGKVVILIIAVILSVVVGNYLGWVMIDLSDGYGLVESLAYNLQLLLFYPEALGYFFGDIALGLLFAGLGVFGVIKKSANEVADVKFKKLS